MSSRKLRIAGSIAGLVFLVGNLASPANAKVNVTTAGSMNTRNAALTNAQYNDAINLILDQLRTTRFNLLWGRPQSGVATVGSARLDIQNPIQGAQNFQVQVGGSTVATALVPTGFQQLDQGVSGQYEQAELVNQLRRALIASLNSVRFNQRNATIYKLTGSYSNAPNEDRELRRRLLSTGAPINVYAGPIYSNAEAKTRCALATSTLGSKWNGNWKTVVAGQSSVCTATVGGK
jgi:Mannan-binding protein